MKTKLHTSSILAAAIAGILTVAGGTAHAGRGGSAERIKDAMQSGSVDAIVAEVERAERLTCPGCVEPLMEALEDNRYEVREVAAWWFARRPVIKAQLTTQGLAALHGSDSIAARNAADMLGAFRHPQAVPALNVAVTNQALSAEARAAAAKALGLIGHLDGNAGLTAALADPDATVRWAAIDAWSLIRGQVGAAPVVARITDTDASVRARAAAVVGTMHEAGALTALEAAVTGDADPEVRRNAAWALGELGDPAARPALTAATTDRSGLVRKTAQASLARL
ncbi:MAG TPA: HEAT repeat domain-containing protein [Kofleriaceae bacterium]|nr:HEAT repeat domain-containing protein [Kofleriaceae bacterium]